MKTKLLFLSLILLMQSGYAQFQESSQVLTGEVIDGFFGFEIAMSDNGQFLAVADPLRFGPSDPNPITLFNRVNDAWVEMGQISNPGPSSIDFGVSMDFSDDGTILAFSVITEGEITGLVRVFQNTNGVFEQIGDDIPNASSIGSTRFGEAVSINSDGTVLAISAPVIEQSSEGEVFVYRNVNDNWVQIGGNLGGDPATDLFFGADLSLSDDGTLLAVGILEGSQGNGRVEFYGINDDSVDELGGFISGSFAGSDFGSSVELNGAGNRIVIGASNPNNNPTYAEVYEDISGGRWVQLGQQISDELNNGNREFGSDVDINAAGDIIVVTDTSFDSGVELDRGGVFFYRFDETNNNWILINMLEGQLSVEELGITVAMDDTGLIATVGGVGIGDIDDNFVGGVRTYTSDLATLSIEDNVLANDVKLFPNPFQNEFTMTIPNLDSNYSYSIIDTYGRVILKNEDIQSNSSHTVNLNQISSGMYFINITQNNKTISSLKLIKQ